MKNANVRVVARFIAKPESVEEVKAVLCDFVAPTRAEKGCILYELLQNSDDPADLTFVEEWESEEDLKVHSQSDHLAAGRKKLEGLLAAPADIRLYRLVL